MHFGSPGAPQRLLREHAALTGAGLSHPYFSDLKAVVLIWEESLQWCQLPSIKAIHIFCTTVWLLWQPWTWDYHSSNYTLPILDYLHYPEFLFRKCCVCPVDVEEQDKVVSFKGNCTTLNLSKALLLKNSRAFLSSLFIPWSPGSLKIFPLEGRTTAWKMYFKWIFVLFLLRGWRGRMVWKDHAWVLRGPAKHWEYLLESQFTDESNLLLKINNNMNTF